MYHFTSALSLYQHVLDIPYKEIVDLAYLIGASSEGEIFWLKRELAYLPFSEGQEFEDCVERLLRFCFKQYFRKFEMEVQHATLSQQRRRDFIISNSRSSSPFLQELKKRNVKFLLFDAKNYRETLKTHHLDTFRNYLIENPNFGNFGIILSRQGASRPCQRHITEVMHYTHIHPPLTIIVLNEEDLLTMLDLAIVNASPLDVVEARHKELLLAR